MNSLPSLKISLKLLFLHLKSMPKHMVRASVLAYLKYHYHTHYLVKVTIVFEFLSGYPLFAPPSISLEIVKGLSPCALDELHEILDQIAAKNIGTSSVHIIVEEAKEWLIDNNFPGSIYINTIFSQTSISQFFFGRTRRIHVLRYGTQSTASRNES